MKELVTGRRFQLWEYCVSHGCLLIRSPKTGTQLFNVDIRFAGVQLISVSRHLEILERCAATEQDVLIACKRVGRSIEPADIHVFVTGTGRQMVVAASMVIETNHLDIFQSPFRSLVDTDIEG